MSNFGDLVKRLRKERSLTLEAVAKKIGSHKGYVSGIENPKAALALVQRTLSLLNLEADLADLEEASRQFDQNLAEIVSQNAKIKAYVAKLESRDKEEDPPATPGSDLPPASELVAEIEQFLRQQRPE